MKMRLLSLDWPCNTSTGGLGLASAVIAKQLSKQGFQVQRCYPIAPPRIKKETIKWNTVSKTVPASSQQHPAPTDGWGCAGSRLLEPYASATTEDVSAETAEVSISDTRIESTLQAETTVRYVEAQVDEYELDKDGLHWEVEGEMLQRPQLILAHHYRHFPMAEMMSAMMNCPWVGYVHALPRDEQGWNELSRVDSSIGVAAVSQALAEKVEKHVGCAVEVVRPGVDDVPGSNWQPAVRLSKQKRLLYAGRLAEEKHVERLLWALHHVNANGEEVHLVIAGEGPDAENLRALASRLGVSRLVQWAGWLSRESLGREISMADALVMSSDDEPFGLVALEAARAGCPVWIRSCAGVAECLPHAHILEGNDPVCWAKQFEDFFTESPKKSRVRSPLAVEARVRSAKTWGKDLQRWLSRQVDGAPMAAFATQTNQ